LTRAVDSGGNAIEENGNSREREANLALRYRLVSKACFSDVEQQTAYRKRALCLRAADTELYGDDSGSLDVAESLRDKNST
jgi:hypothetical protein